MDQDNIEKPHDAGVTYSFSDEECRRLTPSEDAFNKQFEKDAIILRPGDMRFLEDKHKMLVANVGAGVSLTIFDQRLYFGVMACPLITPEMCAAFPHFDTLDASILERALEPIDAAIREMKKRGSAKSRIRIRLFGGANLAQDKDDTGTKNYVFVKEYLTRKGLQVMGEDIGGNHIRRVHFFADTGAVSRFILKRQSDSVALQQAEHDYFSK